jgi:hypothetical protein
VTEELPIAYNRCRRSRYRVVTLRIWESLVGSAGLLAFGSVVNAAAGSAAKPRVAAVATIAPDLGLTMSPKSFRHGTVIIEIKNESSQAEKLEMNGVTSGWVYPHRTGSITVTFRRPAIYEANLPECGFLSTCIGQGAENTPGTSARVT